MNEDLKGKFNVEERKLWKQRRAEYKALDEKWKKVFDDFSLRFRNAKADKEFS